MKPLTLKTSTSIAGSLSVFYLAFCFYIAFQTVCSWPSASSWAQMLTLFLFPGALYNGIKLGLQIRLKKPMPRRWIARILSILLGVPLASAVANASNTQAIQNFEERLAPFIMRVASDTHGECYEWTQNSVLSSLQQQIVNSKYYLSSGKIWRGSGRFIVSFAGGSIDIDGSTLYFDGNQNEWVKYHNDNIDASKKFTMLTSGMQVCHLAKGWQENSDTKS